MRLLSAFLIIGSSVTLLSSCGGAEEIEKTLYEELCECVELSQKVYEEFEAGGSIQDSVPALQAKYQSEFDYCEEVTQAIDLEFSELSDEELKEKELEIRAQCPALDEKIKEQERMQEEMMQGMSMGEGGDFGGELDPEQMEQLQRMLQEMEEGEGHDHDHDDDHEH